MLFSEYLIITEYNTWFVEYDFLFKYIKNKIGAWTCLYNITGMDAQINSIICDNVIELNKIKTLITNNNILDNRKDWGTTGSNNSEVSGNATNNSVQSSVGFDVDGDNSKVSNISDNINKTYSTLQTIQLLDEFIKISHTNLSNVFKNIVKEFILLINTNIVIGGN